jgi:hypothetical protein
MQTLVSRNKYYIFQDEQPYYVGMIIYQNSMQT